MPYIKEEDREKFVGAEEAMGRIQNAGELNYFITRTCLNYLKTNGMRYQVFNDIVGVLNCVVHEFYRRLIGFYEDIKIVENGDVLTAEEMQVISKG